MQTVFIHTDTDVVLYGLITVGSKRTLSLCYLKQYIARRGDEILEVQFTINLKREYIYSYNITSGGIKVQNGKKGEFII